MSPAPRQPPGDDNYRGGAIGRTLGAEADAADIQDVAEHVLRKESNRTSRYVSFTLDLKIARRFTTVDLWVEGLAVESMTQAGLAVGFLCSDLLDRDYFFALDLGAASGHQYAKNASGIHSKGN